MSVTLKMEDFPGEYGWSINYREIHCCEMELNISIIREWVVREDVMKL